MSKGRSRPSSPAAPAEPRADILQGTLDLMVLNALAGMGPQHGYGLARRLEQVAGDMLHLNQGTLYPALLRLQQRGWISGRWGTSENGRRARYYAITSAGRRQLAAETDSWQRTVEMMARLLATGGA
jgi:PadR family transcriptional regulator PadR